MSKGNFLSSFELTRELKKLGKRNAYAAINGSEEYSDIKGIATFRRFGGGTMVEIEVKGLPDYVPAEDGKQPIGPHGFHIHDGGECTPIDGEMPFSDTMGHYNPDNQPHGNHAGDFPVLFSNNGYARMSFFTNRFKPEDIIGKTVVIHLNPDDYRTQPAGDSGKRIACGVIK